MIDQPTGRFDSASGRFVLTEDWYCELKDYVLHIYEGFPSDGFSIPAWMQTAFSPRFDSFNFPAALAHDALYASKYLPRRQADEEFHRLLLLLGMSKFRAWIYYAMVRAFGGVIWDKHTPDMVQAARQLCRIVPKAWLDR